MNQMLLLVFLPASMLFHTVKLVAVQNLLTAILREINSHEEGNGEIRGLHLNPFSCCIWFVD